MKIYLFDHVCAVVISVWRTRDEKCWINVNFVFTKWKDVGFKRYWRTIFNPVIWSVGCVWIFWWAFFPSSCAFVFFFALIPPTNDFCSNGCLLVTQWGVWCCRVFACDVMCVHVCVCACARLWKWKHVDEPDFFGISFDFSTAVSVVALETGSCVGAEAWQTLTCPAVFFKSMRRPDGVIRCPTMNPPSLWWNTKRLPQLVVPSMMAMSASTMSPCRAVWISFFSSFWSPKYFHENCLDEVNVLPSAGPLSSILRRFAATWSSLLEVDEVVRARRVVIESDADDTFTLTWFLDFLFGPLYVVMTLFRIFCFCPEFCYWCETDRSLMRTHHTHTHSHIHAQTQPGSLMRRSRWSCRMRTAWASKVA